MNDTEPDVSAPYKEALAAIVERTETPADADAALTAIRHVARTTLRDGRVEAACDHAVDNPACEHYS